MRRRSEEEGDEAGGVRGRGGRRSSDGRRQDLGAQWRLCVTSWHSRPAHVTPPLLPPSLPVADIIRPMRVKENNWCKGELGDVTFSMMFDSLPPSGGLGAWSCEGGGGISLKARWCFTSYRRC